MIKFINFQRFSKKTEKTQTALKLKVSQDLEQVQVTEDLKSLRFKLYFGKRKDKPLQLKLLG